MMEINFLLIAILSAGFPVYAKEMREIALIRDNYNEILKKIKNGSIYKREIRITYPVIPGVGPAASKVNIYYDMPEGMDGRYEYDILRIENYYQHAGKMFYEEFVYNRKSELMFYFGRRGTGDIGRTESADWSAEERIYFWNGKPVRVQYGPEAIDRFMDNDLKKIEAVLNQAAQVRERSGQASFPQPVLFFPE